MERRRERAPLISTSDRSSRRRRSSRSRSCCATCCSAFSTALYFAILALTVLYLAYFIQLDEYVNRVEQYSDQCILFSRYTKSDPQFTLGYDFSCILTLYGSGVLALFEFILLIMLFITSIWGRWVMFLKVFEVFLLGLCVCGSLGLSIIISLGYSLTCNAQKLYDSDKSAGLRCSDLTLPGDDPVDYGPRLLVIEIVSWLVTVLLIFIFLLQLLVSLCLCCNIERKYKKSSNKIPVYDYTKDLR